MNKAIPLLLTLVLAQLPLPAKAADGGADAKIINMEFKDAQVSDLVRILSEASGLNIVASNGAAERRVTLYLHDVSARQAIEIVSKVGGLWYRHDPAANVYRLMTTEEYQKDLVVFREEKTRIFQLLYPNPVSIASAIRNLYGQRVRYAEAQSGDTLATLGGIGGQAGSSGQFSRQTGSNTGGQGQAAISGSASQSRPEIDKKLTVDQIATLAQKTDKDGEVSLEQLKGIIQQEQDIYIVVVPDQNTVAVRTGDLEAMDNIARLIGQMDRPTSEVLLEMKVLDLTLGDSFHSMFDLKLEDGNTTFGLGDFAAGLSGPTLIYKFLDDHLKANIELLAKENRVDVLATPMLMASNNRPAQLFIGEERVIVTGVNTNTITSINGQTTSFINPQTEVRNVGNTLRILPKINADRTVTLNVQQDASSVLPKSASLPISDGQGGVTDFPIDSVNTANLNATVVAKDGMAVAIGGMIRTTVSNDIQKAPLLGDIPYLGALFSRELRDKKKTELVLLITPHVMMAPAEAAPVSGRVAQPLSRHPYFKDGDAAYDYHFDKFNREGADDRPWAQPANPHYQRSQGVSEVEEYAELTRYAAWTIQSPEGRRVPSQDIQVAELPSKAAVALLDGAEIQAVPLQSWRKGDLYVTALSLRNRAPYPLAVEPGRLRGDWLAATVEKNDLAPGDGTYAYVVSSLPFFRAVKEAF